MLTLFGKKKISENKMANVVVNGMLAMVDEGYTEVCGLVEDDSEFETIPKLDHRDTYPFTLIVLAANIRQIPRQLPPGTGKRLAGLCLSKSALVLGTDRPSLEEELKKYQRYMSRINHPSKNTALAMAKTVFFVYDLNPYQQEYFRSLETPNPMFLKRLRELMHGFIWEWDYWLENYKVV